MLYLLAKILKRFNRKIKINVTAIKQNPILALLVAVESSNNLEQNTLD